jgi:hypothetical protein
MLNYLLLPEITEFAKILDYTDNIVYTSISPGFNAYLIKDYAILHQIRKIFKPMLGEEYNKRTIVWLQKIDSRFNDYIHRDPRIYGISYILKTGGSDVVTSLYDDNQHIKYSTIIKPHCWHVIKTSNLHSVSNIKTERISLSISVGNNINEHFLKMLEKIQNE